jgi:hypothetical protein
MLSVAVRTILGSTLCLAACDLISGEKANACYSQVKEISSVIHSLTQTPPSTQHATVEKYFTRNASFTHPFCRTGSFELSDAVNSRFLVQSIYRWYKIMSPRIDLHVNSVGKERLDQK